MTWFKLKDTKVDEIQELVKKFKADRKTYGDDEPYVLFGAIGTTFGRGKKRKHQARVIPLKSAAGVRAIDIRRLAEQKNFMLLEYYFPDTSVLTPLQGEDVNFESGWRLGLRQDPAFFNGAIQACKDIMAAQDGDSVNVRQLASKDKELAEKDAIIAKMQAFIEAQEASEAKEETPIKEVEDAKKDKKDKKS